MHALKSRSNRHGLRERLLVNKGLLDHLRHSHEATVHSVPVLKAEANLDV